LQKIKKYCSVNITNVLVENNALYYAQVIASQNILVTTMPCTSKHILVFFHGISHLFTDRPFIPRLVRAFKHDTDDEFRTFYVQPFITYKELTPYKRRLARLDCTGFTFDEISFYSLTEDDFKKEFCAYVKDYEVIAVTDQLVETYVRSFVKDKEIIQMRYATCDFCRENKIKRQF
jgi:hypothetical protein